MLRFLLTVFMWILISNMAYAFNPTLDEIFKNIIRIDNEGRLPLYIQEKDSKTPVSEEKSQILKAENTATTDSLKELKETKNNKQEEIEIDIERNISKSSYSDQKLAEAQQKIKLWEILVSKIKTGNINAFDLEKIETLVREKDPKAVELYAWMRATGTGVRQDLQNAWELYSLAANLGVKNAGENANAVYQTMLLNQNKNSL